MSREEILRNISMISVFGLVFSVWCICVILWTVQYFARRKKVRGRLGMDVEGGDQERTLRLWRELQSDVDSPEQAKKSSISEYFKKLQYEAGWKSSAQSVLLRVFLISAAAFAVAYFTGGGISVAVAAPVFIIVPFWIITEKTKTKREVLFEKQLVDALGISARALRAGHPLAGAFQLASEEISEPIGLVFAQIAQEQSLGRDMKESIREVAESTYNQELKLFATAVAIQLDSGGNLADLMDGLAEVMRARARLNRRVRVLTAQTQLSKRILIAMPILLFLFLNVFNPKYMATFYDTPEGRYLLAGTIATVCFGSWIMSRLAVLKY